MAGIKTSLVVTVLNEAATIKVLLKSIDEQERTIEEVIIVDGGSTDGTIELIKKWKRFGKSRLVLIEKKRCQ